MVKAEPTSAKKESEIDAYGEDTPGERADKEERKREKRLRKEAEGAARKAKRHKGKQQHKAIDDDVSNSKVVDERISSPSQERSSGLLISAIPDETPRARGEKKKKKRPKVSLIEDELDAQPPIRTDERTRKDSSDFSRKRRRRDQSP